jgi:hypothetical protein
MEVIKVDDMRAERGVMVEGVEEEQEQQQGTIRGMKFALPVWGPVNFSSFSFDLFFFLLSSLSLSRCALSLSLNTRSPSSLLPSLVFCFPAFWLVDPQA